MQQLAAQGINSRSVQLIRPASGTTSGPCLPLWKGVVRCTRQFPLHALAGRYQQRFVLRQPASRRSPTMP